MFKCLRRVAFTMAEILLSLTIIGVVAAITLPSLTGNINERTWNTQRKALYSRLSQAVALLPQIRGYGSFEKDAGDPSYTWDDKFVSENATETFLSAGLAKVLKINNICDKEHLGDCGLPDKVINVDGSRKVNINELKMLSDFNPLAVTGCGVQNSIDTGAAAFETANGESILLHYNPICSIKNERDSVTSIVSAMCANFIYDLNGTKGPNTIGKDVGFMTLFYSTDSILVAPVVIKDDGNNNSDKNYTFDEARQLCRARDARVPNIEELMAIYMNNAFLDTQFTGGGSNFWSSTERYEQRLNRKVRGTLYHSGGEVYWGVNTSDKNAVRCIKQFQ